MCRMKQLIIFLFLVFLSSCSQTRSNSNGTWFSPQFGILQLTESINAFYQPSCIVPVEIQKSLLKGEYVIDSELVFNCQVGRLSKKIFSVELKPGTSPQSDRLILTSSNKCFPHSEFDDAIELKRIPDKKVKYDSIRVQIKTEAKWQEITLSNNQLRNFDFSTVSFLSSDQMIWLIFYSGFDYYRDTYTPVMKINMQLYRDGQPRNSKTISTFPHPCYLQPLMNFILAEMDD